MAEYEIDFLFRTQRLLSEGLFVATYKYALLMAIADLAIKHGSDSGDQLTLKVTEIAEEMARIYWRQVKPFGIASDVLRQNAGRQAAIIQLLENASQHHTGSIEQLKKDGSWQRCKSKITTVVHTMPLWKIQRVGGVVDDFLYPQTNSSKEIVLRPGVAYCLRKYYSMIRNMIEGAWILHIRRLNTHVLGEVVDLQEFLFGSERSAMSEVQPFFMELQKGKCFYCGKAISASSKGHVDHFIPWSRYPADLGHNLVLADAACNSAKTDLLAAEAHLERWVRRNLSHSKTLNKYFNSHKIAHDDNCTTGVARWAYAGTAKANGPTWIRGKSIERLSGRWQALLDAR